MLHFVYLEVKIAKTHQDKLPTLPLAWWDQVMTKKLDYCSQCPSYCSLLQNLVCYLILVVRFLWEERVLLNLTTLHVEQLIQFKDQVAEHKKRWDQYLLTLKNLQANQEIENLFFDFPLHLLALSLTVPIISFLVPKDFLAHSMECFVQLQHSTIVSSR